jgi:hypothetical protein
MILTILFLTHSTSTRFTHDNGILILLALYFLMKLQFKSILELGTTKVTTIWLIWTYLLMLLLFLVFNKTFAILKIRALYLIKLAFLLVIK